MAYPVVSAPYGMRAVNLIGGHPFAGSTRLMPIGTGNATAIFFGDVVKLVSGLIVKDVGTDAATPIGIFMGCSFTDPNTLQKTFKQYYPGSITASDIKAYVVDDPQTVFKIAVVSATTVISGVAGSAIGSNGILVQNTGSTITGDSANALLATIGTTTTQPLRIVDLVEETRNAAGSYTEVLVKWNFGMHRYENTTGTA